MSARESLEAEFRRLAEATDHDTDWTHDLLQTRCDITDTWLDWYYFCSPRRITKLMASHGEYVRLIKRLSHEALAECTRERDEARRLVVKFDTDRSGVKSERFHAHERGWTLKFDPETT